ncbi:MAG: endonuclease MutS2, partial [Firmicutes bacterium]|nr:endonuclease MutS2 [Candidatus Caballimonas caccae]
MIYQKTIKSIEFDKILSFVAEKAVLNNTKENLLNFEPKNNLQEVKLLLAKTKESYDLLYKYSVSGIYFVTDVEDALLRSEKGGTLNTREILDIAEALRGARILKTSIEKVNDVNIKYIPEIASRLFINQEFEKEVSTKILSEDKISDNASPKLYSIRKSIVNLNAKIREQLSSYMHGSMGKYLQDNVVTVRQDRYVIPVKSEYKSFVKGFVHDQSSTGSTVFIEPEMVMELNNQLKTATIEESEEIHRILAELSHKVTFMADGIRYNYENIAEIDEFYARAIYSFENKYTYPNVNDKGIFDIKKGRHPLIDKNKVVPITYNFGEDYNFLLITGPNTGGKTVTLKLTGLIALMVMSGIFVPCEEDSTVSIFSDVFCDVGDEQSIEQSLSTFPSHITNIINIVNNCNEKSLVLIDEIGAGTDPEEGSALALAIIEKLLEKNCFGIITTHYSKLKEFASSGTRIKNASMEFNPVSLKPMYKINIGIPGSSNAIEIAKTLGLNNEIINKSISYLSDKKISFENVLKSAEESRREAEKVTEELNKLKEEKEILLKNIQEEKDKIVFERERIYREAMSETKRIVSEKLCEAEEIIDELKSILK